MDLASEIVGGVTQIGSLISNVLTSNNAVEIAKYQADIAKSNASSEEKKYALKLAQDRLDKVQADEDKKAKNKNYLIYGGIAFVLVLIGGIVLYVFKSKPEVSVQDVPNGANEVANVSVPKPISLT